MVDGYIIKRIMAVHRLSSDSMLSFPNKTTDVLLMGYSHDIFKNIELTYIVL